MVVSERNFPYTDITIFMHSPFTFAARLRPKGLKEEEQWGGREEVGRDGRNPLERRVAEALAKKLGNKPSPDVEWTINELSELVEIGPEFAAKVSPLRAKVTTFLKSVPSHMAFSEEDLKSAEYFLDFYFNASVLFTQELRLQFKNPLSVRELIQLLEKLYVERRSSELSLCRVMKEYLEAAREVCLFDSEPNSAPLEESMGKIKELMKNIKAAESKQEGFGRYSEANRLLDWCYALIAVTQPDLDPYDPQQRELLILPVAQLMQTPLEQIKEMLTYHYEPDFLLVLGWNLGVLITRPNSDLYNGIPFPRCLNQFIEVLSSNWQMLLNYYELLTEELQASQKKTKEANGEQLRRLRELKVEIEHHYGEFDVSYFCQDYYQVLAAQTLEHSWVQEPLYQNLRRRLDLLDTMVTQRHDEYMERRDREAAERQARLNEIIFTLTIFAFVSATATIVATVDYPASMHFHWGRFWSTLGLTLPLYLLALTARRVRDWFRRDI